MAPPRARALMMGWGCGLGPGVGRSDARRDPNARQEGPSRIRRPEGVICIFRAGVWNAVACA